MDLTPALKEKVEKALQQALKDAKPRPAVERIIGARITGKYTHYVQYLLAYTPKTFGVAYVNINKPSEPTVKISDPSSASGKLWTRKELVKLAREEKKLERAEAKAKEAKKG